MTGQDDALSLALSDASPNAVSEFLRSRVREIAERGGRIASTRRAYVDAAQRVMPWIQLHGLTPERMTPELAAAALLAMGTAQAPYNAQYSPASVRLTATAIRIALAQQGFDASAWCSPIVGAVLKELDQRAPPKATTPIRLPELRHMVGLLAATPNGYRIRAALLCAYAGALRVGELSSLQWDRVGVNGQDLVVQVRRKRHSEWCEVRLLAASEISLCPVRALNHLRQIDVVIHPEQPIFSAARTIQGWVTALAQRAGLAGQFSPHSLRHGWASDAASAGIPLPAIQRHLGHASSSTTARYASHADLRAFY